MAAVASAQSFEWIQRNPAIAPGDNSWNALDWDHVSNQFLFYGHLDTTQTTIYSTDFWHLDAGALWNNQPPWIHLFGSDSSNMTASCAVSNTSAGPADSHPYRHAAIDTTRDLYWMTNGARSQCQGVGQQRWGYMSLHDPTHTWTWLSAPHTSSDIVFQGQLIYFANYDVFMFYGPNTGSYWEQQMYCPTVPFGGGTPTGVVSKMQQTVGCTNANADTWISITTAANPSNPHGNNPGSQFCGDPRGCIRFGPAGVYMPSTGTAFVFGGWDNTSSVNSNVAWELGWNGSAWRWNELCQASGCTPPPGGANYPPIAFDTKRNLLYYHWTDGTNTADYYYSRSVDKWFPAGTGGGSRDAQISIGYDPVNDKLVSQSNSGGYIPATYITDPTIFGSGTGSGTSTGTGTGTIMPPVAATAPAAPAAAKPLSSLGTGTGTGTGVSASQTVRLGSGCSTAYFIDNDCDGHGVAVRADGNYTMAGNVGDTPDADDNDPTVSTVGDWRTKYGSGPTDTSFITLQKFLLASRGYNTTQSRVWYVSASAADNTDCTANGNGTNINHPCRDWALAATAYHDGNGGLILFRAGTYDPTTFTGPAYQPSASSSSSPLILMAYPGEAVIFSSAYDLQLSSSYWPGKNLANVIVEGLILRNPLAGDCVAVTYAVNWIFRRNEFSACPDTAIRANNHIQKLLIEGNVFHDTGAHAIYLGYESPYAVPHAYGQDFDFGQDAANYAAGTSVGADQNITIRNNLSYRDGRSGYESFHINSYIDQITVENNIIHSSTTGSTAMGFQSGIYHAIIQNNLIFNNLGCAITFSQYNGDNQAATHRWNTIINNTIWNGLSTSSGTCGIHLTDYTGNNGMVTVTNGSTAVAWASSSNAVNDQFITAWPSGMVIQFNSVTYHIASVTDSTHLTLVEPYTGSSGTVAYSAPTVDGVHYMKDFTIANNIFATPNVDPSTYQAVALPLLFDRSSYPSTHTITNNLFWSTISSWNSSTYPVMAQVASSGPPGTPTGGTAVLLADNVTTQYRYNLAQFQAYYSGSPNTVGNPLLVSANPANNSTPQVFDFHLGSGSPAINFGTTTGAPAVDLQGNTRSGQPDAGAYEYLGNTTAGPSSPPNFDLNGDGVVNVLDVQLAIDQVLGVVACKTADFNGDGQCTEADIQMIVSNVIGQ